MVCPHNVVWFVMPEKALYPFPAVQTVCYFLGNNHSPVHRQGCCQLGELMSAWWTTLVRHRYSNIYSANTEMCAPQLLNSHLSWRTCSKVKKKRTTRLCSFLSWTQSVVKAVLQTLCSRCQNSLRLVGTTSPVVPGAVCYPGLSQEERVHRCLPQPLWNVSKTSLSLLAWLMDFWQSAIFWRLSSKRKHLDERWNKNFG